MSKLIKSALISVFYKDGLETLVPTLHQLGVTLYSTGGTQQFIEKLGIPVVPVENLTSYPSILGGRVKTLHPVVFGGILGKRADAVHVQEMAQYNIPEIDLVIVDLYPFEETVAAFSSLAGGGQEGAESAIIEKIDIGGPSMIRAAAKNFSDLVVLSSKDDYAVLNDMLLAQNGTTTLEQRRLFAAKAFEVVKRYDIAIADYFLHTTPEVGTKKTLRYGENPHQSATFEGNLAELFEQVNGKELSYNNLVDVDAAMQLIREFEAPSNSPSGGQQNPTTFAIIKHTNVCGISQRPTVKAAWDAALAGDPESAFGGVLVTNGPLDLETANAINEIFFEVLIAPAYKEDALAVLKSKKNRILLQLKAQPAGTTQYRSLLNGVLSQNNDIGNYTEWNEVGGRPCTEAEKAELAFANLVCKHLKSNAIALIKNRQLVGKGCGQTSRIDALRHSIEKARQFNFDLNGAVLASDAFFPFDDCVKIAHAEGIEAFIQPGGSIRDKDSIEYCQQNGLAMVLTGMRHFRH
ncbi:MAG: bifunctional phosphoribosylaminoimidazolecarboxamide formyltransferase/IMP cyclohydrolase [Chitinophagaceae bacterium]|nr:bifunctional phosphoribosylaminoimidazolecarboxamide formyltransferase/IMP cyclohydrolase [Chitinophagaceae bacterium]